MVLTEESAAGVTIVAIAGRLDTQTVHRFSDRLTELLRSGRPHLLIEASRLKYISSMGFRALLVAAKSAAANGGCLAMCSLTAPVQRVTALAGLSDIIDTYVSREDALAKLSPG